MASFKIFEDQENIKPEIAAKQVQKPQYQTKRQVLGALQNKALPNVNKTTKVCNRQTCACIKLVNTCHLYCF